MEDGHLMADHVRMLVSIPPKYAVAQVVGYLKGQERHPHRANPPGRRQNYIGQHFWARGYFVSTVGRDEENVREYIRNQEEEDERQHQRNMWTGWPPVGG